MMPFPKKYLLKPALVLSPVVVALGRGVCNEQAKLAETAGRALARHGALLVTADVGNRLWRVTAAPVSNP
jgi:hypothetical protein